MKKLLILLGLITITVNAEVVEQETNIDKAIQFFKSYVYTPSTIILTNSILDKLEIKDILKLLDDRIHSTINSILDRNKEAQSIYLLNGNSSPEIKDKIRTIYMDMANQFNTLASLQQVYSRVMVLYPEEHMHKLFNVLQKIYAKQYQITYNPEEDKKSFWDIFTGA